MHTASNSTRRSGITTRWFRTCANVLLYAHTERSDLRGVNRDAFGVQMTLSDNKIAATPQQQSHNEISCYTHEMPSSLGKALQLP